jgi:hypothetical protein
MMLLLREPAGSKIYRRATVFSLVFAARCGDRLGLMAWLSFQHSSARLTQPAG